MGSDKSRAGSWIQMTGARMARLGERMNTLQANLAATLEGFRTDMAKRETRMVFYMIAIVSVGLTIFGFVTA